MLLRVVARIFEGNAFGSGLREFLAPGRLGQRRQRKGKTRRAVRHAIEPARSGALPDPGPLPFRPEPRLAQQVLAALHCPAQHVVGSGVAIKPQHGEDRAGAAADDVQLLVGRDEVVGEQFRRLPCIRELVVVVQACRHHRQRVDDRA